MSRPDPYRRAQGPQQFQRQYQQPQQYPPQYGQRPPQYQPPPPEPAYDDGGRGLRLPGLGLLLSIAGLVVQALSLTVLPWLTNPAGDGSLTAWDLVTELSATGFGDWYLVLFGYPLAALGVVLAFVSVLESVALKVIWAGLTIVGLGWLVLRYGFGPFAEAVGGSGLDLSRQEIITAVVAVAVLVVVIFMLRTAMVMFRRVAGVILLIAGGVHLYAIQDMVVDSDVLSVGAYGPALGYLLGAVAAFVGPRRLLPG